MFNSPVVDVVIGLIFVFMTVSLATTAVTEALASALKWRQGTLLEGIKALLNDPKFTGLAKDLYGHALINPLASKAVATVKELEAKPAYIDSTHFAIALVGQFEKNQGGKTLKEAVDAITDPQLKTAMQNLLSAVQEDRDQFMKAVGSWFDSAMERLSGGYKRRAQLVGFLVALVISVALNADAIHIARTIWSTPSSRAILTVPTAEPDPSQVTARIKELDQAALLGWQKAPEGWEYLTALIGFILVAGASLLGAPFWFDTLQRIVQIAGTGPAPRKTTPAK